MRRLPGHIGISCGPPRSMWACSISPRPFFRLIELIIYKYRFPRKTPYLRSPELSVGQNEGKIEAKKMAAAVSADSWQGGPKNKFMGKF